MVILKQMYEKSSVLMQLIQLEGVRNAFTLQEIPGGNNAVQQEIKNVRGLMSNLLKLNGVSHT